MHAFLLEAGGELTLVDTLYDTDGHRVLEAIRSAGRSPADLKRIVVTHGHRSHLGGLAALKRASGATVYAHAWEADIVAGERETQRVTLVPKRPLRAYFPLQVGLGKHPPCPVDEAVADEDAIGPLPRRLRAGALSRAPGVRLAGTRAPDPATRSPRGRNSAPAGRRST